MYFSRHASVILSRNIQKANVQHAKISFLNHWRNYGGKFRKRQLQEWLRNQSIEVACTCVKQLEFVIAQRVRRTIQVFHLYTRLWNRAVLQDFMRTWRCRVLKNGTSMIGAAIGIRVFDWEKGRISDEEVDSCYQEINLIRELKDLTVVCPECHLRLVVDAVQNEIQYCSCNNNKSVINDCEETEWKPFIECKDMIVWRRSEEGSRGLYAYKVYGTFADVTAEDFLKVQIDVDYRKQWDDTAKELQVIESDPDTNDENCGHNEIIYWEMVWPRLFANRDYVYQRKWVKDEENEITVIISKSTEHPSVPEKQDTHRVSTYWSYIVIKPYKSFHEEGIEFSLTYFDDPGVNIPSAVKSWVAISGFPNYLYRMREATKDYKKYLSSKESLLPNTTDFQENEITPSFDAEEEIVFPPSENENSLDERIEKSDGEEKCETKEQEMESEIEIPENQGFLGYFFFARLFA